MVDQGSAAGMTEQMVAVTIMDTVYMDVAVGTCCRIDQQPELEQGGTEEAVIVSIP